MPIKIEMQVSPYLMRDAAFWTDVQSIAATQKILLRSRYDHAEHKTTITAVSEDDPTRIGEACILDAEARRVHWSNDGITQLYREAIRFAAWQLVHFGDEEDDDE